MWPLLSKIRFSWFPDDASWPQVTPQVGMKYLTVTRNDHHHGVIKICAQSVVRKIKITEHPTYMIMCGFISSFILKTLLRYENANNVLIITRMNNVCSVPFVPLFHKWCYIIFEVFPGKVSGSSAFGRWMKNCSSLYQMMGGLLG